MQPTARELRIKAWGELSNRTRPKKSEEKTGEVATAIWGGDQAAWLPGVDKGSLYKK